MDKNARNEEEINDLLLLSKLDEYKRFCSEGADIVKKNIKTSNVIYVRADGK